MRTKGSEWNRWDLHFHTPSSYDYKDKSVVNKDIIDEMNKNNISVFAVTDHHTINIEKFENLRVLGEKSGITVLPGIEFLSKAAGKEPVHFIGIFSETSDLNFIWGQIENRTEIKRIKGENRKPNEVPCDLEKTAELVQELGGIVTIHAGKKSNSIDNITNSLPHNIAQKTDIAKVIDIFELGKEDDQANYNKQVVPFLKKKINKIIPMIICSDNHDIKNYSIKQKLWIKGSPNFEGLKYALNEPDERFFIGDEPPLLGKVRENKTKYIKSLSIIQSGKDDPKNTWFNNVEIPFNSELVTIIGNKGCGKSAIADIIALCTDAEHSNDFLFLQKDKFLKKGFGDRFSASITYESGSKTKSRILTHKIDDSAQHRVRYIPQTYFDKICNETGKADAFRDEIEKVVFQYIPDHKTLQQNSFKGLVEFKKKAIDKEVSNLTERILITNKKIISIEDKLDPTYKKNLISKKKIKEEELKAHESTKPKPIDDPSKSSESKDIKEKKERLKGWSDKKNVIQDKIDKSKTETSDRSVLIEELVTLKREVKSKIDDLTKYVESKENVIKQAEINLNCTRSPQISLVNNS
jgi:hypothetical protein